MPDISEARERVLNAAEKLFMERGYDAVKLKDIAQALGIKQASLYYHVPGGKQDLFVEVVTRSMDRHRAGMERAIAEAGDDWVQQLREAAAWLLSQPQMDLTRMIHMDMQALNPSLAHGLMDASYNAILRPVDIVFKQAARAGHLRELDYSLLSGAFLSLIQGVHSVREEWTDRSKYDMADELIDVMVNGLRPR
jgi:AcrR family transcriptional regulator